MIFFFFFQSNHLTGKNETRPFNSIHGDFVRFRVKCDFWVYFFPVVYDVTYLQYVQTVNRIPYTEISSIRFRIVNLSYNPPLHPEMDSKTEIVSNHL